MTSTAIELGATAGLIGGAGWAIFPWGTPFTEAAEGTVPPVGEVASAVCFWLLLVVPALLLLLGLGALHAHHRPRYGRVGTAGAVLTGIGLGAMFTGLASEATTITLSGAESAVGHVIWMLGSLLLLPGSILLGAAVWRARMAGGLLVSVIPAAVAVAVVVPARRPHTGPAARPEESRWTLSRW